MTDPSPQPARPSDSVHGRGSPPGGGAAALQPHSAIRPYQVRQPPHEAGTSEYRYVIVEPAPARPPQVVVVMKLRSVLLAGLLALLAGPIGMLYSTVLGAAVMLVVTVVAERLTMTFGIVLTWPACIIWSCVAARNHNVRLVELCGGRRW